LPTSTDNDGQHYFRTLILTKLIATHHFSRFEAKYLTFQHSSAHIILLLINICIIPPGKLLVISIPFRLDAETKLLYCRLYRHYWVLTLPYLHTWQWLCYFDILRNKFHFDYTLMPGALAHLHASPHFEQLLNATRSFLDYLYEDTIITSAPAFHHLHHTGPISSLRINYAIFHFSVLFITIADRHWPRHFEHFRI
jgi:hypothetical protein